MEKLSVEEIFLKWMGSFIEAFLLYVNWNQLWLMFELMRRVIEENLKSVEDKKWFNTVKMGLLERSLVTMLHSNQNQSHFRISPLEN